MKDYKRIDRILKKLRIIWKNYPELRLGQLVQDYFGDTEGFYLEDRALEDQLDLWIETNHLK